MPIATEVHTLYPEQLKEIADLITRLNEFTSEIEKSITVDRIPVLDESATILLGYIVDEIGGAWSFRAATLQNRWVTLPELKAKISVESDSIPVDMAYTVKVVIQVENILNALEAAGVNWKDGHFKVQPVRWH